MATLPAFLKRTDMPVRQDSPAVGALAALPDALRKLESPTRSAAGGRLLLLQKIDNSRLVREADPKAAASCWSAIGAALRRLWRCSPACSRRN